MVRDVSIVDILGGVFNVMKEISGWLRGGDGKADGLG